MIKKITLQVQFIGIDSWNRPTFKAINRENFYIGDTGNLFREGATEGEVLKFYNDLPLERHLTYFGSNFDCEPNGDSLEKFEIEIAKCANKSIKGLLIDPENRTITEVDIQADDDGSHLKSMYETLNCEWVDACGGGLDWLPGGCHDDVWFDDEGMLGEPEYFFQIPGWHPLAGRGLILGNNEGCSVSHTLSEMQIEELRRYIGWSISESRWLNHV